MSDLTSLPSWNEFEDYTDTRSIDYERGFSFVTKCDVSLW